MDLGGLREAIGPLENDDGVHSPVRRTKMFMAADEEGEDSEDVEETDREMSRGFRKERELGSDEEENYVEVEDSDEEFQRDEESLREMYDRVTQYGDVLDDAATNDKAEAARSLFLGALDGDTRVVEAVQERGDALFKGRLDWLGLLWEKVKGLPPTTELISACWKGHVDQTAALSHRKANTKAATAFTLARFAAWPDRLQAWMNHPAVLEPAFQEYPTEQQALHYLACIINHVEQEVYNMFVEERREAKSITMSYPSTHYPISQPRGQTLYYICGWMASRAWSHAVRENLSQDWVRIVEHNTDQSSEVARGRNSMICQFVEVVDRKNDPENGPGLLYASLQWVEFVFALERAYFHFLKDPAYLEGFLWDLPAAMLKVVTEAEYVKEKWRDCCPPGIDQTVFWQCFNFVVEKFHNFRMGEYAKSLTENSSLKFTKASVTLRQKLNAQTGVRGGAGGGAGGDADGGARQERTGEGSGGGGTKDAVRKRGQGRRQPPPTLDQLKGMSREEVSLRCTTRQLVVLKNQAGINRGTINSRKCDLLDYLDEFVGGFKHGSVEGVGPTAAGTGPLGGGDGGHDGNLGGGDASMGRGEVLSSGHGLPRVGVPLEEGLDDGFLSRPIAAMDSSLSLLEGPGAPNLAIVEEGTEPGREG